MGTESVLQYYSPLCFILAKTALWGRLCSQRVTGASRVGICTWISHSLVQHYTCSNLHCALLWIDLWFYCLWSLSSCMIIWMTLHYGGVILCFPTPSNWNVKNLTHQQLVLARLKGCVSNQACWTAVKHFVKLSIVHSQVTYLFYSCSLQDQSGPWNQLSWSEYPSKTVGSAW